MINLALDNERRQRNLQAKLCKYNIGLKLLSGSLDEKFTQFKAHAVNKIKDHTLGGLRRQRQFDKEFDLLHANEQSEIQEVSDHDDDFKDDDRVVTNILSKFHPDNEQSDSERDMREELVVESPKYLEFTNKEFKNEERENVSKDGSGKPKIDFHSKIPLSIDILNAESEDDDNEKLIILNSKGEKRMRPVRLDTNGDEDDENDSNYSPWVQREVKESPLQNYK